MDLIKCSKNISKITAYNDYGYPILSYNVGEKSIHEFKKSINSQVGDKVEIRYHKNNPTYRDG